MENVVGAKVLEDRRRESYCQLVASGVEELEAWQVAFCDECGKPRQKRTSALSSRAKCGKRAEVVARLSWLRERNAEKARLSREEKLAITEDVIRGLKRDFDSGERGKTVGDLMAALVRHDAMTGVRDGGGVKITLDLGSLTKGVDGLVEARLGIKGGDRPMVAVSVEAGGGAVGKEGGGETIDVS